MVPSRVLCFYAITRFWKNGPLTSPHQGCPTHTGLALNTGRPCCVTRLNGPNGAPIPYKWNYATHAAGRVVHPADMCISRPGFPATAIEKFGSIAFPVNTWESFHAAAAEVPPFPKVAHANGRALRDAWAVGQTRPRSVERLVPMLRACAIAADTLDVADAIHWIEHWLRWFEERGETEIEGVLASDDTTGAALEKLYFDGPGTDDWPAYAEINM